MKYLLTVVFFLTLILAEVPSSDASVAATKVDEETIREMVSEVVANLLQSSSDKTELSETLVVEEPTVGDKLKRASDGLGEKAKEVKDSSKTKLKQAKDYLSKKEKQAKGYLSKKEKQAADYLKSEQAQKDKENLLGKLASVKQAMKDYYEEETKSAEATEDKSTAPTPADIQPVNAALDTGKTLHSQASIWSAMLVLVCVLGIAGTITYCVQEKDVITYSADAEMERLFKGGYYQSQESRPVY